MPLLPIASVEQGPTAWVTTSRDAAVRSYCRWLGRGDRLGSSHVRHPFGPTHQAHADLPANEEPGAVQLLLGHTKLESTVRYFGIEIDDALEIAEQTEA